MWDIGRITPKGMSGPKISGKVSRIWVGKRSSWRAMRITPLGLPVLPEV